MRRAMWLVAALGGGAGWAAGCTPKDAPGDPAPVEGAATAEGPAATAPTASAEQDVRALAEAIEAATDVDHLRREYVATLPAPPESARAGLEATAADAAAHPAARVAARVALGAFIEPARGLAIRAFLNEAVKATPANARRTSALGVRLLAALHPPVEAAVAALPEAAGEDLPPSTAGEAAAWSAAVAASPLPPLTAADVPYLLRLALTERASSPRLAWLLAAPMDDPAVTEALLHLPGAGFGGSQAGRDLAWWALALHATTEGGRARLRAALDTPGRAGDRAAAVLAWSGDRAAAAAAGALLTRLAQSPEAVAAAPFDVADLIDATARFTDVEAAADGLSAYGATDAPLARRARALARAAGIGPDVERLLDAIAADPTDARARVSAQPHLDARHGPRLAGLLARDRWAVRGFFHWVRMLERVPAAALTPEVAAALAAVAGEHPEANTREWALRALARAEGPLPPVVAEAAAKGSKAGVRTLVMRAEDPWGALWSRASGDDDAVRRAAYEVLLAPRLLPFEPTAEQAAQIVVHTARHLTARPEDPWVFLRALHHYVEAARPALDDAAQVAVARALRPYSVTTGPDGKPWWDALFVVASLPHAEARAVVADAVRSVPTAGARAVMRERLGLPPDPNDAPPPPDLGPPRRTGH